MHETWVPHLIREDPICLGTTKPMHHNYWAHALKPRSWNYWNPHMLEPLLFNKESHGNEKPAYCNWSVAPVPSTREKPKQQQRPSTAKINKWNLILKKLKKGHVRMWELDCEESWVPKNWCFWTVVLEKTLESPLDCKEIQPAILKEISPGISETPVLWPPHAKSWLIGKDSDVGRDWGQEEKEMTEDEMAGWHHWLNGCESEWTPGVGDGQGGLACCNSWGCKESDMTEWLNRTKKKNLVPVRL